MGKTTVGTETEVKYQSDLEAYAKFLFEQEMEREKSISSRATSMITVLSLSLAAISVSMDFLIKTWSNIENELPFIFALLAGEFAFSFILCLTCAIKAQIWKPIQWFLDAKEWKELIGQVKYDDSLKHQYLFQAYCEVQKTVEMSNNKRLDMLGASVRMYALSIYFFLSTVGITFADIFNDFQKSLPFISIWIFVVQVGAGFIIFMLNRDKLIIHKGRDSDNATRELPARESDASGRSNHD